MNYIFFDVDGVLNGTNKDGKFIDSEVHEDNFASLRKIYIYPLNSSGINLQSFLFTLFYFILILVTNKNESNERINK